MTASDGSVSKQTFVRRARHVGRGGGIARSQTAAFGNKVVRSSNSSVSKARRTLADWLRGGYHEGTDPKEDLCLERRFAHFCSLCSSPLRPVAPSP